MALFPRGAKAVFDVLDPRHAGAAAALHATAFAHGWSEIEFERLLAAGTTLTDAAFEARSEVLAGFILSRLAADEAEVLTIVVAQRWRGRGLGRDLLDRHIDHLARERIKALFLEVNEDNAPARALYARARFAEVGRRAAYYPALADTARADALILRRAIG